jgi:hypothetical protein
MIKHIGTIPINTERLTLRKFTHDDISDVYGKWTSCPDSDFWEPPHKNIVSVHGFPSLSPINALPSHG